jgi:hypothetical protein
LNTGQTPGYPDPLTVPYAPALRPGRPTDRDSDERETHG